MARSPLFAAVILAALVLLTVPAGAEPSAKQTPAGASTLLLGETYPIEAPLSFPGALMHWLDSVTYLRGTGMTAGKTVDAHRRTYLDYMGTPSEEDQRLLEGYRDVRVRFASSDTRDRNALTRAFFEARSIDGALERAGTLLRERDTKILSDAVRRYESGYRRIWKDGEVARGFLERVEGNKQKDDLAEFLKGVAAFVDVDPAQTPRPRLVLAPVPRNVGTHAQAIEEFLLVEVRRGDGLKDQIAPIVHENVHLLFQRMGPSRIKELERAALAHGAMGSAAWQHLKEALPTAIAQGVAQFNFRVEGWSFEARWYDVEMVDVFAKKIFPNVKRALSTGRKLDAALIDEFVDVYTRAVAPRAAGAASTPRSP